MVLVTVCCIPFLTGFGCNPCGNGKLDKGETCDDGNVVGGDGCSGTCQTETADTTCATTTVAALQTGARSVDPAWDTFVSTTAGRIHVSTTPSAAYACNEGGATTQYIAVLPKTTGGTYNAVLVTRKDPQLGDLRTFIMLKTGTHTVRWFFHSFAIDGDDMNGFTATLNADGTPWTPGTAAPLVAPTLPALPPGGEFADPNASNDVSPGGDVAQLPDGTMQALVACSTSPKQPAFQSCPVSNDGYKKCIDKESVVVTGGASVAAAGELLNFIKKGGVASALTAAGATLVAIGPAAECAYARPDCMIGATCALGRCSGEYCLPAMGDPGTTSICDANCETCGVDVEGDPACTGLAICDIPDPVHTCNAASVPIHVTYCGHVRAGNHLSLGFTNLTCASGFVCSGSSATGTADGSGMVDLPNAIGCSGACPAGASHFTWAGILTEVETQEISPAFTFASTCLGS